MHHRPRTYYGKKLVKRGLYEKKGQKINQENSTVYDQK